MAENQESSSGGSRGRKLWLFQFKADESRAWLGRMRAGRIEPWRASRYRKEMTAGDIVFFWQSGTEGGLHGKGFIVEGENAASDNAVDVRVEKWLRSPILRKRVLAAEAISRENQLFTVRTGTNFKLNPEEAEGLDLLLREVGIPTASEAVRQLLHRHGIAAATSQAASVIDQASRYVVREGQRAQVTSTRLLLALVDFGESLSQGDDGAAAAALARTFRADQRLKFEYEKLKTDYLDKQTSSLQPKSVTLSANVARIVSRAIEVGNEFYGYENSLTADGLVVALLRSPESGAERRLDKQEMSLELFPELMLQHFASPDDRARFASATGISSNRLADVVAFAGLGNDDPWGAGLKDTLGVGAEAVAFARVATARSYKPPFAFGIFGDWGSGKSFFMRLIYDHIESIRAGTATEAASPEFVRETVQIRFNAWHYAEQNLWASLVDHIFAELDRSQRSKSGKYLTDGLLENLSTARELTLEAAETLVRKRSEQKAAAERLAAAKVALVDAQQQARSTPLAVWKVAWDQLVADKKTRENVKTAAETLGLESVAAVGHDVQASLNELQGTLSDGKVVFRGMLVQLTSPWLICLTVIAVLFLPQALVFFRDAVGSLGSPDGKNWVSQINQTALTVAGLLSAAAALLRVAARRVGRAVSELKSFRERLENEFANQTSAEKETLLAREKQVVTSAAAADEARAVLTTLTDSLADAESEYAAGTGRTRLLNFIRDRAADGHYAKHLGLVASIRKDFADISAMVEDRSTQVGTETKSLREAYGKRVDSFLEQDGKALDIGEQDKLRKSKNPPVTEEKSFRRIVLYIDDLDRCRPDKVVDVLQAVHLLLTFPLFVVIVAVDTRWVSKALEQHYQSLVVSIDSDQPQEGIASARDYLEKIFQVPYWVRPMESDASRAFLNAKASEGDQVSTGNGRDKSSSEEFVAGKQSELSDEPTSPPLSLQPIDSDAGSGEVVAGEEASSGRATPEKAAAVIRSIHLTPAERGFMSLIATCVATTPRRSLRFLNVYRVIKAGLDSVQIDELENKAGYRALMVQLAISTSSPHLLKLWLGSLDGLKQNEVDALLPYLQEKPWFRGTPMVSGALAAFREPPVRKSDGSSEENGEAVNAMLRQAVPNLRKYGAWARRFSFGG